MSSRRPPDHHPFDRHALDARRPLNAMVRGGRRHWVIGILSGAIALAALVIGSNWGHVDSTKIDPKIIAWSSAVAILVFGGLSTSRLALAFSHGVASRSVAAAGGAIRIFVGAVGILFVVFSILAVLDVSVEKLLVGVGLAGVVLGIAAQQSLGNIFAGIVLIVTRPFRIGDHIRIRSGALGGIFDAWVREMSLTYVTLQTVEGEIKVPNSALLAAAVGPVPPGTPITPPVSGAAAAPAPGPAPPPAPGAVAPDGSPAGAEAQRP